MRGTKLFEFGFVMGGFDQLIPLKQCGLIYLPELVLVLYFSRENKQLELPQV